MFISNTVNQMSHASLIAQARPVARAALSGEQASVPAARPMPAAMTGGVPVAVQTSSRLKQKVKAGKPVSALDVLQAFNTWAFKREQPDTPETLKSTLERAMATGRAVEFVLYWGKGPRSGASAHEIACLDYLAAMAARIRAVYPEGAVFRLIFTDTHATLNGHAADRMNAYFDSVAALAAERGFTTCRLGDLLVAHDRDNLFHVEGDLSLDPMFDRLTRCAAKWYAGEGCAEEGAEQYYRMNLREARVVEIAFPDSVFVTFNGSTFRGLFPNQLPIFYMYSMKRGCAVKPWFLPEPVLEPEAGKEISSGQEA
jgi:hypothetical protein